MAIPALKPKLSIQDYLEGEKISPIRHEYVGGDVYAMAGASEEHNFITGNVFAALHAHLRGKRCRPFIHDMKVKVWTNQDLFYYPDLMVACDPTDSDRFFKGQPTVLFEVISDSTRRVDEQEKLLAYLRIDSLQEYVMIEQDFMKATVLRRANEWKREEVSSPAEPLSIPSLAFTLPLRDVYEGVFDAS